MYVAAISHMMQPPYRICDMMQQTMQSAIGIAVRTTPDHITIVDFNSVHTGVADPARPASLWLPASRHYLTRTLPERSA